MGCRGPHRRGQKWHPAGDRLVGPACWPRLGNPLLGPAGAIRTIFRMRKLQPQPCPMSMLPGAWADIRPWVSKAPVNAGMLLAGLASSGCNGNASASAPSGSLWWFATLALLGMAFAGYFIGRLGERQRLAADLFDARSGQTALLASLDGTAWRTDASHRFVDLNHSPAPYKGPTPAWARDPALLPLLQAQRGFANVQFSAQHPTAQLQTREAVECLPPGSDDLTPCAWLLRGQPVLDLRGQFAGFVGTARALGSANLAAVAAKPEPPPQAQTAALQSTAATKDLVSGRADSDEADSFSFTVAHDLRAPIRVVDGFTRIVKEDYGHLLDRVANDHLERVLNAAARMNRMIDALLTLASLSNQPLSRQSVDLSQLAHLVIDELQRSQPAREVEVKIEDGLVVVGDPTLLRLVLENLLGNAWKYSSRTAQAQISLSSRSHGDGRAFVVRDNGAGFDMRAADRLFGVFQRLHSASEFPGHGVGLASARRIVRRHGGDIWADSEPARGASFTFTLAEH